MSEFTSETIATEPGQIYAALAAVNRAVAAIGKNQTNTGQGWKFRGVDDVMNALHPLFAEHGILVAQVDREVSIDTAGKMRLTTLTTDWYLYAEDGSSICLSTITQGADNSDKGATKAASLGYKYALLRLFSVPTEGQIDGDSETIEVTTDDWASKPATLKQIEYINAGLQVTGANKEKFLNYFGVKRVEDLDCGQAEEANRLLKSKAKQEGIDGN